MRLGRPGRIRRFLAKLALVVTGFVIGAIIAEIGLRTAKYSFPDFYKLDESRGYALRPGAEGWFRKEGKSYVRINSDGMRDRDHSKAKPENTIRIAVIGDSYPEALPVAMEQSFWVVMEKELQKCGAFPDKNVEVLNFGVAGYGTAQELITLREHVWDYSPDIVLLAVTTSNDITDNSLELRKRVQAPYFIFRNGVLTLDNSFRYSKTFEFRQSKIAQMGNWITNHSRLFQAVGEASRGLRILLLSWRSRLKNSNESAQGDGQPENDTVARSEELGTDNIVYLEPGNEVWNDAWHVTEQLIVTMRDEVKTRGASLLVVTLSNGPQVLPDPGARQAFMRRFGITDLFYPDNRIKSLCLRENIPVVTLAPDLQAYAEQNKVYLHGFDQNIGNGHWNVLGQRIAGELIAQKICAGVLVK